MNLKHLGSALAVVFAMIAQFAAIAEAAAPQESDGRVPAVSFEEHALIPPVSAAAVLKIDGVSPELPDSSKKTHTLWKPFAPMTIMTQIIVGAMGTAFGGAIGFYLEDWTGLYFGLHAGMEFGVLLGGVGNGGPGGVGAFLASFAGSFTGYLLCERLQRSLNGASDSGEAILINLVASLTTSILFYHLLATFDSAARVDTPPPAQTNNRNDIPETWRDNTLYSVPILPPDMWLVPVLTVRF